MRKIKNLKGQYVFTKKYGTCQIIAFSYTRRSYVIVDTDGKKHYEREKDITKYEKF